MEIQHFNRHPAVCIQMNSGKYNNPDVIITISENIEITNCSNKVKSQKAPIKK